ncbi:hypothetical protein ASG12_03875 [Williamsia sp. Leaf354]|nr:hypothetical protein ASG12_03875 [Williamsia sp. Leaf354]
MEAGGLFGTGSGQNRPDECSRKGDESDRPGLIQPGNECLEHRGSAQVDEGLPTGGTDRQPRLDLVVTGRDRGEQVPAGEGGSGHASADDDAGHRDQILRIPVEDRDADDHSDGDRRAAPARHERCRHRMSEGPQPPGCGDDGDGEHDRDDHGGQAPVGDRPAQDESDHGELQHRAQSGSDRGPALANPVPAQDGHRDGDEHGPTDGQPNPVLHRSTPAVGRSGTRWQREAPSDGLDLSPYVVELSATTLRLALRTFQQIQLRDLADEGVGGQLEFPHEVRRLEGIAVRGLRHRHLPNVDSHAKPPLWTRSAERSLRSHVDAVSTGR